jgi:predicted metal-dependent enzyme (double-stranded beta helix superfamily)
MFDIAGFVAECEAALAESQPALAVKELVERAVARPDQIDAALGTANQGGFQCLHRSPKMTVLQFVWPPGVQLFPHNHLMWAANGIFGGGEDNTFYRRTPDGLDTSGGKQLKAGDVALLGADVIHAVANPNRAYTAALHVYGGDYFATPRSQWDPTTLCEQPFDVEAVRRVLDDADRRTRQERAG